MLCGHCVRAARSMQNMNVTGLRLVAIDLNVSLGFIKNGWKSVTCGKCTMICDTPG